VHSLSIIETDQNEYLVLNYWNDQSIELFDLSDLVASSSDALNDSRKAQINVEDYAPFKALEVDKVHAFAINGLSYLIVTLSNGYVICFNLYPKALKAASLE